MGLPAQRVFKGPSTPKTAALDLHNDGCSADNCYRKMLKTPKDHTKVTYSVIGVSRVREVVILVRFSRLIPGFGHFQEKWDYHSLRS